MIKFKTTDPTIAEKMAKWGVDGKIFSNSFVVGEIKNEEFKMYNNTTDPEGFELVLTYEFELDMIPYGLVWNKEFREIFKGHILVPICGCGGLDEGYCPSCGMITAYKIVQSEEGYHYAFTI